MANVSGLLGTAGGFKGTGVDDPNNWVDSGKLEQANSNLQTQFGNQSGLLAQLQAQNGLGNQSSVYNQMQGVANGTGPNPAQAQLAQATQANTANQAALMAGQRGSSQNAGLIARQAAMQGGANQQQSAGQAATLQAQQSLGALSQMGGIANTQAANQIGQTNANQQAAQANQTALLGGNAQQNALKGQLITGTAQQQAAVGGGAMSGAGSSLMAMADGGQVSSNAPAPDASAYKGSSKFGKYLQSQGDKMAIQSMDAGSQDLYKGASDLGKGIVNAFSSSPGAKNEADMEPAMAEGGKVPVLLSPGEKKLTPDKVKAVERGADPMKIGETVPGKPKVSGAKNDYANDTVKTEEEPGTIILPRSVTQSKHPHWAAHKFMVELAAKKGKLPPKPKGKK